MKSKWTRTDHAAASAIGITLVEAPPRKTDFTRALEASACQMDNIRGLDELHQMIQGAGEAFDNPDQRWEAMGAIEWRLRGPNGQYVGLDGVRAAFVPEEKALTFSGHDNEVRKIVYFQAVLRERISVEVLQNQIP